MVLKRVMLYVWALTIALGACVEDECFLALVMVLGGALGMYELLNGKTKEEIYELAGAYWLEKKTGWNLTGEDE